MSNLSAREELELRQMGQRGWLTSEMEEFLTKRERALLEACEAAVEEWAEEYAEWRENNPGPSGIPSDPPALRLESRISKLGKEI